MDQSLCILGRQAAISLAELESLYGADNVKPLANYAALVSRPPSEIDFKRLGGTVKLARVLTELPTKKWQKISNYLVKEVPKQLSYVPPGKVKFGLSVYGLHLKPAQLNATGLKVKKASKPVGRSMRVIPNKTSILNAAQVLNNQLTTDMGMELLLIKNDDKTILAKTIHVQDIDDYAKRDRSRPKRDPKVGMLPPKLAQTIINLANPSKEASVLDPFCGTGVILQEALLMGFNAYGTDREQRMIDFSNTNLEWLELAYDSQLEGLSYLLEPGDATDLLWQPFDTIACETYLGQPFSAEPKADKLAQVIRDVDTIHKKFLKNVAKQTKSGFKMCIAVPAWHTKHSVRHLPTLDRLTDMGYTRMSFVHAKTQDLIYHRENQIVGRELVVLIRK